MKAYQCLLTLMVMIVVAPSVRADEIVYIKNTKNLNRTAAQANSDTVIVVAERETENIEFQEVNRYRHEDEVDRINRTSDELASQILNPKKAAAAERQDGLQVALLPKKR